MQEFYDNYDNWREGKWDILGEFLNKEDHYL